uniref:Uncharacterized protein n=1 Tax=Ananas comosus var. bracteatus TaxID=296719 RepID=A0A6V7QMC4_ANACO|nr:unnamed protein product [Ananas comosus var. bracteatus]
MRRGSHHPWPSPRVAQTTSGLPGDLLFRRAQLHSQELYSGAAWAEVTHTSTAPPSPLRVFTTDSSRPRGKHHHSRCPTRPLPLPRCHPELEPSALLAASLKAQLPSFPAAGHEEREAPLPPPPPDPTPAGARVGVLLALFECPRDPTKPCWLVATTIFEDWRRWISGGGV